LIPIEAAGGYVVRNNGGVVELLLIFRRGVWDLPKGKTDFGETPAECALREVAEETGAEGLVILRGAGSTLHMYEEDGRRIVKTTWWFFMSTTSNHFVPEEREQIERVEWVAWPEACERVGYKNLLDHMAGLQSLLAEVV